MERLPNHLFRTIQHIYNRKVGSNHSGHCIRRLGNSHNRLLCYFLGRQKSGVAKTRDDKRIRILLPVSLDDLGENSGNRQIFIIHALNALRSRTGTYRIHLCIGTGKFFSGYCNVLCHRPSCIGINNLNLHTVSPFAQNNHIFP